MLTDKLEIKRITGDLLSTNSPGHDITEKSTVDLISAVLFDIFNIIFQGRFPDKLKLARVVLIYKSDNRTSLTNYRPISVLPVFSKILEKIMCNRITDFVTKNKMLNENQFGFRGQRSTYMELLQLLDKVTNELDNNHYSVGVFLDLSKAFDTINHGLLID